MILQIEVQHFMYLNIFPSFFSQISAQIEVQHFMYLNKGLLGDAKSDVD